MDVRSIQRSLLNLRPPLSNVQPRRPSEWAFHKSLVVLGKSGQASETKQQSQELCEAKSQSLLKPDKPKVISLARRISKVRVLSFDVSNFTSLVLGEKPPLKTKRYDSSQLKPKTLRREAPEVHVIRLRALKPSVSKRRTMSCPRLTKIKVVLPRQSFDCSVQTKW
jgi:hypothetical protein